MSPFLVIRCHAGEYRVHTPRGAYLVARDGAHWTVTPPRHHAPSGPPYATKAAAIEAIRRDVRRTGASP